MEIFRNAYQIQSLYGARNLFQYLFVGDCTVLLDTGVAETPENAIFPYMDKLGIFPRDLSVVITSHPDIDHQGGNSTIKKFAPAAKLACGEADQEMVEDPVVLFRERYNFAKAEHGVGFPDDEPWVDAGKRQNIDVAFRGGERIQVSDHCELSVLHVPGHSYGHLALYDAANRIAFVSDAIHGRGCPNADGTMGIPVTYYYVDLYLSTLHYFEKLKIDKLYSGHWPTMQHEEVADFIADSRRMVDFIDKIVVHGLSRHASGLTLKELMTAVAEAVGEWPRDTWFLTTFPVKGHLDRLRARNKVRLIRAVPFPKWQLVP